jgi:hypothetical protein
MHTACYQVFLPQFVPWISDHEVEPRVRGSSNNVSPNPNLYMNVEVGEAEATMLRDQDIIERKIKNCVEMKKRIRRKKVCG